MKEMFGGVALGLLLLVIGAGAGNEGVTLVGVFILPLALLWGGLFKAGQSMPLKLTLLAIAGVLLAVTVRTLCAPGLELPW